MFTLRRYTPADLETYDALDRISKITYADGSTIGYVRDATGNVTSFSDNTGTATFRYDPYGNITNTQNSTPMQNNPWHFDSGYSDGFGLTKFGIRYDDTTIGRWTQHTPIGGSLQETTKANPYVCTEDNPVNVTDTNGAGNCVVDVALSILGGAFTAFSATGYGIALLEAANSGETITLASFLFNPAGPSILASIGVGVGIVLAGYFFAELIQQCLNG